MKRVRQRRNAKNLFSFILFSSVWFCVWIRILIGISNISFVSHWRNPPVSHGEKRMITSYTNDTVEVSQVALLDYNISYMSIVVNIFCK